MGHMKILFVDHNEDTGTACVEALEKQDFSVDWVTNGLSALEVLKSGAYGFVITELNLPYFRGTDLHLRVVEKRPELEDRFLYIGYAEPEDMREQNIIKGRFMAKPFAISSFVEYVKATIKNEYVNLR